MKNWNGNATTKYEVKRAIAKVKSYNEQHGTDYQVLTKGVQQNGIKAYRITIASVIDENNIDVIGKKDYEFCEKSQVDMDRNYMWITDDCKVLKVLTKEQE
jgi:hypothetical protein